jgi:phosphotriesterase-related protein
MVIDILGNPVRSRGRILVHEHLQFGWPGADLDFAVGRPASIEADVAAMRELADAGFSCFVDATPMECQRDLTRLRAVSLESPVQIVGATGLYHARSGYPAHFAALSAADLAEIYIRDLRGDNTSGVPAGVIKVATGRPPFAQREARALMAAARASLATDAPIVSHAESLEAAWEQQRIFSAEGLPPERAVLGHLDAEWPDPDRVAELAQTGAFIGIDRCGIEAFAPHERRVQLLSALKASRVIGQALLSHDSILRFVGREAEAIPNPFLVIARTIVPMLLAAGFSDDELDGVLRRNPERFLGIAAEGA